MPAGEVARLTTWIDAGALWPASADHAVRDPRRHWAFQPIGRPEVPPSATAPVDAGHNPIDRFIAQRLAGKGLSLSPEADRRTLAIRLYLVLLGLRPTPEELDAFVADPRPGLRNTG